HFLENVPLLGEGGGERFDADGSAAVAFGETSHVAAVHRIEAAGIHFESQKRGIGDLPVDLAVTSDRRKIANATEQPSRHSRGPAGAPRNLERPVGREAHRKQSGTAGDDSPKLFGAVELQA